MQYRLKIGARDFAVEVGMQYAGSLRVSVNGNPYDVTVIREAPAAAFQEVLAGPDRGSLPNRAMTTAPAGSVPPADAAGGSVLAPIPGLIVEVKVRVGDTVQAGQTVAVMEAMKMENNLTTLLSGVVKEICVQKGSEVATGDVILHIG